MQQSICFVNRLAFNPGGRCTFIRNLSKGLEKKYYCSNISGNKSNRVYSFGLIHFFIQSFVQVWNLNPDYVIGVGLSSLGSLIAGFIKRKPIVYNLSGPNVISLRKRSFSLRQVYGIFFTRFVEKMALSLATVITVPSNTSKEIIRIEYGARIARKIQVIPEGIPLDNHPSKKYVNYLLFPWMTERKNLSFFLEHLPSILAKTSFNVLFMGFAEMIPEFHLKKLALFKERIKYTGIINEKQFPLAELLVYIPPHEAHSYTVLEAAREGMPVLISHVDWLADEFQDYPLKINNFTGKELEQAIIFFSKNKKRLSSKIQSNFSLLLKKYDYSAMIKEYCFLLKSLEQH